MANLAGLGNWFKKTLETTKNGLNFTDNVGWTANQPVRTAQPTPTPAQAAPKAPQYRNPQIQQAALNVRSGKLSPDAFANYVSGLGPAHETPDMAPKAYRLANAGAQAVINPYAQTVAAGYHGVRGQGQQFKNSLDQSIAGGVGRFGQSVSSWALSPVSNRLAQQEADRATRLLSPVYGQNNAEIEAGQIKYGLMTDPLTRSGIGVNDSLGTTIRKVGAQAGEAALDIATLGPTGKAVKAGMGINQVRPFIQNVGKSGALGAAGNTLYATQQEGVRPQDLAQAAATGFATGAALPLALTGAGKLARSAVGGLVPQRPYKLTDEEVGLISHVRQKALNNAMVDEDLYSQAKAALNRIGVQTSDVGKIDEILGDYRTYNTRKQKSERGAIGGDMPIEDTGKLKKNTIPLELKASKRIGDKVETDIPLNKLVITEAGPRNGEGRSFTKGPIDVTYDPKKDLYYINDGATRFEEAKARGDKAIKGIVEFGEHEYNDFGDAIGHSPIKAADYYKSMQPTKGATDLSTNTNARPQADLQRAYEDARNAGDTVAMEKVARQLNDPGMTASQLPKPTKDKLIAEARQKASLMTDESDGSPVQTQKPSRFANTTVQNSDEVSAPLQKMVKEEKVTYTPTSDIERRTVAQDTLKNLSDDDAFTHVMNRLDNEPADSNGQTNVTAIELIKRLDEKGDDNSLFKATEIFHRMSEKASARGQEIQALSALSARTPQGMYYMAEKNLGKQATPENLKTLRQLTDQVKKQVPGSYEDGLARYKVMEFVAKKQPASAAAKGVQLWKAGLLSAPTTTGGNLLANTAEQVYKRGYKDPLAAGIDKVFSLFTGERGKSLTYRGILEGAQEGVGKGISYFKTGYDPRNPLEKFDVKSIHYSDTPLGKAAETYTQSIFRLMGSQDQPFYYASLRNSLADQAVTAAKNAGMKGAEREVFIKKYVTEPAVQALELADKEARYDVFQNPTALGNVAKRVNQGPIGQFLIPFSQVPSSVATRMIDRTPIGFGRELVSQIKAGKFDQRAMSNAIADASAGVAIIGAGRALASAGELTLSWPTDQAERDLWELEGKQANSVKIYNPLKRKEEWVSLNYLQPLGTLLAAGANYQGAVNDGKDQLGAYSSAVAGASKALTEQSFLKGISGALTALSDPQRSAEKFAENTTGSLMPNFIRSAARSGDPVQREQDGLGEAFIGSIPGLRQTLPEKTNIFGEALPRKTSAANSFLNPLRPSDVLPTNSLNGELRRLQGVDEGITATKIQSDALGKDIKLDRDQKLALKNQIGQMLKQGWSNAVSDGRYQALADAERRDILDDIKRDITAAVKAQYSVSTGLRDPDPSKLSRNVRLLLSGQEVDYFGKNIKTSSPRTSSIKTGTKKVTTKKSGSSSRRGRGVSLPKISVGISSDLQNPVVTRSSYRAPNIQLKSKGRARIRVASKKVKLNAPRRLSTRSVA